MVTEQEINQAVTELQKAIQADVAATRAYREAVAQFGSSSPKALKAGEATGEMVSNRKIAELSMERIRLLVNLSR